MTYVKSFLLFFFPRRAINLKFSLFSSKYQFILNHAGLKILKCAENLSFDDIYKILILKDYPLIIDVGAHEGESIDRFKKIFNDATIHSFEPNLENIKYLDKYKNEKTIINYVALSDRSGKIDFYKNSIVSGSASFYKPTMNTIWNKQNLKKSKSDKIELIKKIQVETQTLDEYVESNSIDIIDILKIDTQGSEDKVLHGAKNSLESGIIQCIEVEIMIQQLYEYKTNFFNLEKYLIPNNYKIFAINRSGNLLNDPNLYIDVLYVKN